MISITYSFIATRTGDYYFAACETPLCVSCGGSPPSFIEQTNNPPVRSSVNSASCSLYTFVASAANTQVSIEQCLVYRPVPALQPSSFTHSLRYQAGEIAFICSATAPKLENGSYTNFGTINQPSSPCDCGKIPSTTTTTTITTTVAPLFRSWRAMKVCYCSNIPGTATISNITISAVTYPGQVYKHPIDGDCYRLVNTVPYPTTNPNRYWTLNPSGLSSDCTKCDSIGANPCPATTTTSTTTVFSVGGINTCGCINNFECRAYYVDGDYGDAIKWKECTQSIGNPGFPNFNYYYFSKTTSIKFCSCTNEVEIVMGAPTVNGVKLVPGGIPVGDAICTSIADGRSECFQCQGFNIELGEEIGNFTELPAEIDYMSCFEPEGGWAYGGEMKMSWPTTNIGTFSGLPLPHPFWSPIPRNGQFIFPRKTQLYSLCGCGNGKSLDDPGFVGPTISYYDAGYAPATLTFNTSNLSGLNYYIRTGCSGGTCSCYNYDPCTTTTTTLIPCPNCRPTVIGASGSGPTNITYEGCDGLVKHNIEYDYLIQGNTSSICACERCRSVRARPLGTIGIPRILEYVHCCDPVFNAANVMQGGFVPPSYHSSVLNLQVRNCRTLTLSCGVSLGFTCKFQYVNCNDSKIYEITMPAGTIDICATTASTIVGAPLTGITNVGSCGTASAEICISRDYYGPTVFPDDPILGSVGLSEFTFSNIGSCSCITSDNRYNPYNFSRFNTLISTLDPNIESLTITFSSATCSDKTSPPSPPPPPIIPPCCDCKTYKVTLTAGNIVNYKPCEVNRDPAGVMSLSFPQIYAGNSTQSTGSFSVRVSATGFYGVGSFSIVFNHNKLVFYTASVIQNSLIANGRIHTSGSFSRFVWQNTSGAYFGSADILNFTFAAQSSANLDFISLTYGLFYSASNVANFTGQTLSVGLNSGWIKFPGINLPASTKNSIPPSFPSYP